MTDQEYPGVEWAEMVADSEKNLAMNKKLFITVCPTGALYSRTHNLNQPYAPKEIAKETIEAFKEGACATHIQTRDDLGNPQVATDMKHGRQIGTPQEARELLGMT